MHRGTTCRGAFAKVMRCRQLPPPPRLLLYSAQLGAPHQEECMPQPPTISSKYATSDAKMCAENEFQFQRIIAD